MDLAAVHAPLLAQGLSHEHFDLLLRYLCDTMIELGINEHLILEAVDRVEATRADVMGETYNKIEREKTMLGRSLMFAFGIFCYRLGVASLVYAMPWLEDFWLSNTLDSERTTDLTTAIGINLSLLVMFALQHSIMARPGFKA